VEASALKTPASGLHGRSPLLRLQSDERLIALVRRGNHRAFEALVGRYQARLLAFCRHMLGSREDAEDVLQEVFAAAFNAILGDDRPINVRPWLYRIARNRSLNHLRRATAVGVDSMDVHLAEGGLTTADKVHRREEFRLLIADVQELPETQRTALLLREMDALSYEQIAEAMETTVPSVKSLLVRARVSLAEASEARLLTCEDVRLELGEVAEGLRRTSAPVRRHLRTCKRCATFRKQLRASQKAMAALFPIAPLLIFKKLMLAHVLGTSAAAGGGAAAAGGAACGGGAAAAAGAGIVGSKAAAGLAAAAIVTAGAVEVRHVTKPDRPATRTTVVAAAQPPAPTRAAVAPVAPAVVPLDPAPRVAEAIAASEAGTVATGTKEDEAKDEAKDAKADAKVRPTPTPTPTPTPAVIAVPTATPVPAVPGVPPAAPAPVVQHETSTTVLPTQTAAETLPAGPPAITPLPAAAAPPPAAPQPAAAPPASPPVEAAPVEAAPVEAPPVEAAPVEAEAQPVP